MRHFGKVDKDQIPNSDYLYTEKPFKKKKNPQHKKEGSKIFIIN